MWNEIEEGVCEYKSINTVATNMEIMEQTEDIITTQSAWQTLEWPSTTASTKMIPAKSSTKVTVSNVPHLKRGYIYSDEYIEYLKIRAELQSAIIFQEPVTTIIVDTTTSIYPTSTVVTSTTTASTTTTITTFTTTSTTTTTVAVEMCPNFVKDFEH